MAYLSIQFRRHLAGEWDSLNPVLPEGELGLEALEILEDGGLVFPANPETGLPQAKFKIGDGFLPWRKLAYAARFNVLIQQAGLSLGSDEAILSVQLKQKSAEDWAAANDILTPGEIGVEALEANSSGGLIYENDPETGRAWAPFKIGDGHSSWNSLDYAGRLNLLTDQEGLPIDAEEEFAGLAREALSTAEAARGEARAASEMAGQAQVVGAAAAETAGQAQTASTAATETAGQAKAAADAALGAAEAARDRATEAFEALQAIEEAGGVSEAAVQEAAQSAALAAEAAQRAETVALEAKALAENADRLVRAGEVYTTEAEAVNANDFFQAAARLYLTNSESTGLPADLTFPLWLQVLVDSGADEEGNIAVTQNVWDSAGAAAYRRLGSVSRIYDPEEETEQVSVDWSSWTQAGGGGGVPSSGLRDWNTSDTFGVDRNELVWREGQIYKTLGPSGPGTAAGVVDPAEELEVVPGEPAGDVWGQVTLPVLGSWYGAMVVTPTGRIVALSQNSTICIYSDNNGQTWTQVTLPVSGSWRRSMVVTPTGRIVALSQNSTICIYSDTNGQTWTQVTLPVSGNWQGAMVVTQTGRIVALSQHTTICIYSDNNGQTWTQVTLPVLGNWYGAMVVTQTGRIVALGNNTTICIYSDNNGQTWTQVTLPVLGNWSGAMVVTQTGRIVALGNNSTICIYSDNNGQTWTQVTLPVSGNWLSSMVVTQTGRNVALSYNSTICIYSDPSPDELTWNPHWEKLDTTPVGASVLAVGKNPPSRRAIFYDGGLLSRTDYAELWAKVEKLCSPVEDAAWTDNQYSTGDGSTTFRIPKKTYGTGTNEFLQAA